MCLIRIGQLEVRIGLLIDVYAFDFEACKDVRLYENVHDIQFIDSPKLRNKATTGIGRNSRSAGTSRRTVLPKAKSVAHDIVVVREANKKGTTEIDSDLRRLQVSTRIERVLCAFRRFCHILLSFEAIFV